MSSCKLRRQIASIVYYVPQCRLRTLSLRNSSNCEHRTFLQIYMRIKWNESEECVVRKSKFREKCHYRRNVNKQGIAGMQICSLHSFPVYWKGADATKKGSENKRYFLFTELFILDNENACTFRFPAIFRIEIGGRDLAAVIKMGIEGKWDKKGG